MFPVTDFGTFRGCKTVDMKKLALLTLVAALSAFAFSQEVSLNLNAPEEMEAGQESLITIEVQKGAVSGFARFTQDMLPGIHLRVKDAAGADFSFENGQLNMVWLNLPQGQTFTFSYYLKTDKRVKGKLRLGGRFTFIVNESERKDALLYPKQIQINPAKDVDEKLAVNLNDQEEIVQIETDQHPIKGTRLLPVQTSENEWLVRIEMVSAGGITAAYIEEMLPLGAQAQAIETAGSIFTFRNGQARFFWNKMPANKTFSVAYKIKTNEPVDLQTSTLSGVVNYRKGYRYEMIKVVQSKQEPEGLSRPVSQAFKKEAPPAEEKQAGQKEVLAAAPEKEVVKSGEVVFRIQIAVLSREISHTALQDAMGVELPEGMQIVPKGNVFQYSVGAFKTYDEAKKASDKLVKNGVKGAFVVAFQGEEKISIQRARLLSE